MTDKDIKICGHGGGRPSIKNLYEYSQERYKKLAPNGKHKGICCVKRHKKMTDSLRKKFVATYDIIIGRNYYNQSRRSYVFTKYKDGKYYSDCSSSGMATMRKIGLDIGSWLLNTAAIYESDLFEFVDVTIKDGHIMNPEVLKVGDCILFVGSDPKRPRGIGHVEYVYSVPAAKKETSGSVATSSPAGASTTTTVTAESIGEVTSEGLNIRSKAGTGNKVVGTLKKGDYVYITKEQDGWAYVNGEGWASLKYIKKYAIETQKADSGKVIAKLLNARKAPVNGDVLKILKKGTKVKITKTFTADGKIWGYDSVSKTWISLKYVQL